MEGLMSLTIIFLLVTQYSTLAQENSPNLIDTTCMHTPFYQLCISSLQSDPRSATATDVTKLALILFDLISTKGAEIQNRIQDLLKGTTDPQLRQALSQCYDKYDAVLKGDVPVAIEALTKGNPKFAEESANDAANEANSCENKFQIKTSPITDFNKNMHDLSIVAAYIVKIILES